MRLATSIILLGSSFWTPAGAVNKLEDKRCFTNVTALQCKIERRAHIAVSMDPFEECYVVFRDPGNNYRCCYGPKEVCDAYENGKECLQPNIEYFIHNDPKTCTLVIESVVKAQAGLYKFFNMDGNEIQECFVEVVAEPSDMISVPRPAFIALMVVLVFLVVLFFIAWAFLVYRQAHKEKETNCQVQLKQINCQAQTERNQLPGSN